MHEPTHDQRVVAQSVAAWAMSRLGDRAGRATNAEVQPGTALPPISGPGIGTTRAWDVLRDQVLASANATDHPRYLAFVGGAPSVSAVLADMAVSAAGIYAGSELEAGIVVAAERAALRWLSDVIGLPSGAHGAFVSGGSMANLSALVTARDAVRRTGRPRPNLVVAGAGAHSSVRAAANVMGCDVLNVGNHDDRLSAASLRRALNDVDVLDVVAVVATAGATNTGIIDELDGIADVCAEFGLWLHVDAAYGGAALLSPRRKADFAGIAQADSVTINPHKWLFTPYECAAVIYRDPELARATHTQSAPYLEAVVGADQDNPADYALHLSRRPRGLPLWMSLIAHGTDSYSSAVERCLDLATHAAMQISSSPFFELAIEPTLSVVVFRRRGWLSADYHVWSATARRSGLGLVTPTTFHGTTALRFCFVNPQTTESDIAAVLADIAQFDVETTRTG